MLNIAVYCSLNSLRVENKRFCEKSHGCTFYFWLVAIENIYLSLLTNVTNLTELEIIYVYI